MLKFWLIPVLLLVWLAGHAQDKCKLTLSGTVLESSTGEPLEFAEIYIREVEKGAVVDATGSFLIADLCPGDYHVRISHLSCAPETRFIRLDTSVSIVFNLDHHTELLDEISIHGSHAGHTTQVHQTVDADQIRQQGSENLADILNSVSGVRSIKNGAGISKPVIHGLTGNRVGIVNNGTMQAGQQWGNDHAPEIDPFVADHISVIKGAGSLEYGGNTLGTVIVVKPGHIPDDPHLHGTLNYSLQTNGWGHTLNSQISKSSNWGRWRATGTIKYSGDTHTPDYFLTNTGRREYDAAFQWENTLFDNWETELYYSFFHTDIGILRGSHIGNLTDLEEALNRDEPFFTKDDFSYEINAPRQKVNHHLIKTSALHQLSKNSDILVQYTGQLNDREEYDVRRGNRSDRPALSLQQFHHTIDVHYKVSSPQIDLMKIGIQGTLTDNKNNPETGVRPLIPDYSAYSTGVFGLIRDEINRFSWEAGARYDLTYRDVATITNTIPATIKRYKNTWHRVSTTGGVSYEISESWTSTLNLAGIIRNPEVNELYSNGLHQGVSGIEEGSPDLVSEKSLKILLSQKIDLNNRAFFQLSGYYQHVDDYIFLEPQDELRLTIRGAFPVYKYKQTNARLMGWDFLWKMEWHPQWQSTLMYAGVRGEDLNIDEPLIWMPADRVDGSVTYSFKDGKRLRNTSFSVSGSYVAQQNRYNPEQDFLDPPGEYFLLSASLSSSITLAGKDLKVSLSGENLLNKSYRDYLNRLRYFADEMGVNVRLGLEWKW